MAPPISITSIGNSALILRGPNDAVVVPSLQFTQATNAEVVDIIARVPNIDGITEGSWELWAVEGAATATDGTQSTATRLFEFKYHPIFTELELYPPSVPAGYPVAVQMRIVYSMIFTTPLSTDFVAKRGEETIEVAHDRGFTQDGNEAMVYIFAREFTAEEIGTYGIFPTDNSPIHFTGNQLATDRPVATFEVTPEATADVKRHFEDAIESDVLEDDFWGRDGESTYVIKFTEGLSIRYKTRRRDAGQTPVPAIPLAIELSNGERVAYMRWDALNGLDSPIDGSNGIAHLRSTDGMPWGANTSYLLVNDDTDGFRIIVTTESGGTHIAFIPVDFYAVETEWRGGYPGATDLQEGELYALGVRLPIDRHQQFIRVYFEWWPSFDELSVTTHELIPGAGYAYIPAPPVGDYALRGYVLYSDAPQVVELNAFFTVLQPADPATVQSTFSVPSTAEAGSEVVPTETFADTVVDVDYTVVPEP